ncbi:tetratricopeptide repeat protein, partial [Candidatus Dependentiae bacterium]|nr:tetratricopeptide repeat protein [Candidatus Dependentiae bacterium]
EGLFTESLDFYIKAAKIYDELGDQDKAFEIFKKVGQLDPTNMEIHLSLGNKMVSEGKMLEAVEEFLVVLRNYCDNEKIDEANDVLKRIKDLLPESAQYYYGKGLVEEVLDHLDEATALLKKSANIDPYYIESMIELGNVYLKKGKEDNALIIFKRALRINPEKPGIHYGLGQVFQKKDHIPKALEEYIQAAEGFEGKGLKNKALRIYQTIVELEPENQLALDKLEKYQVKVNVKKGGESMLDLAKSAGEDIDESPTETPVTKPEETAKTPIVVVPPIEEDKESGLSAAEKRKVSEHLAESEIYKNHGLFDKAISELNKVFQILPNDPDAHLKISNLYLEIGDKDKKIEHSLIAVDCFSNLGNKKKAKQILDDLIELAPENSAIRDKIKVITGVGPIIEPEEVEVEEPVEEEIEVEETPPAPIPTPTPAPAPAMPIDIGEETIVQPLPVVEEEEEEEVVEEEVESVPEPEPTPEPEPEPIPAPTPAPEPEPVLDTSGAINIDDLAAPTPGQKTAPDEDIEATIESFADAADDILEDEDYKAHYDLGLAYKSMGLLDKSIYEFQISSKDDDTYLASCDEIADCFLQQDMPEAAMKWAKKGLDREGYSADYYLNLWFNYGVALESLEKEEEALDAFKNVYQENARFRGVSKRIKALKKKLKPKAKTVISAPPPSIPGKEEEPVEEEKPAPPPKAASVPEPEPEPIAEPTPPKEKKPKAKTEEEKKKAKKKRSKISYI